MDTDVKRLSEVPGDIDNKKEKNKLTFSRQGFNRLRRGRLVGPKRRRYSMIDIIRKV